VGGNDKMQGLVAGTENIASQVMAHGLHLLS